MSADRLSSRLVLLERTAWSILPVVSAGLAHVAVLKTDAFRRLAVPLDGGRQWRARPALGQNKTWRGVLLMTAVTGAFTRLQMVVGREHTRVLGLPYEYRKGPWSAGAIMGLGYCLGELPNSFVKRRLGIAPGARSPRVATVQYAIDQLDSVAGCLLALRLFYLPRRGETALAICMGTAIHFRSVS